MPRSRFSRVAITALVLGACGETPRASTMTTPIAPAPTDAQAAAHRRRPVKPMESTPRPVPKLAIDWSKTPLATEADALAVWAKIAPTGDDWQEKLDEVPAPAVRPLAIALLRGGQFTCMTPPPPLADPRARECRRPAYDVDAPASTAGFDAPCLRRVLALWALDRLEPGDLPPVLDALRGIVAIPAPESELVDAAIAAVPERERATRLELIGIALAAGQTDTIDRFLTSLDEPALVTAATTFHSANALTVLSAEGERATYLAAVTDAQMPRSARIGAIADLLTVDVMTPPAKLGADLHAALVAATAATDCGVAAVAVRALVSTGEPKYLPKRGTTVPAMMRALCVLASYERLQGADEPSLLASFVPAKGLERLAVTYDPLGETDEDGDGDVHTARQLDLVPRATIAFPQTDEATRAMQSCDGTICRSLDTEVRFVIKPGAGGLRLVRIELYDRPPCPSAPFAPLPAP